MVKKKLGARLLSIVLSAAILFSMTQSIALAAEGALSGGGSAWQMKDSGGAKDSGQPALPGEEQLKAAPPCKNNSESDKLLDRLLELLEKRQAMLGEHGVQDLSGQAAFEKLSKEIDALYAHMDECEICALQVGEGGAYYARFYGTAMLGDAVAMIGSTPYATLQAAFDAAVDRDTVVVQKDISQNTGVKILLEGKVALDLNGHTISITSVDSDCINVAKAGFIITDKSGGTQGTLTLNASGIAAANGDSAKALACGGTLEVSNVNLNAAADASDTKRNCVAVLVGSIDTPDDRFAVIENSNVSVKTSGKMIFEGGTGTYEGMALTTSGGLHVKNSKIDAVSAVTTVQHNNGIYSYGDILVENSEVNAEVGAAGINVGLRGENARLIDGSKVNVIATKGTHSTLGFSSRSLIVEDSELTACASAVENGKKRTWYATGVSVTNLSIKGASKINAEANGAPTFLGSSGIDAESILAEGGEITARSGKGTMHSQAIIVRYLKLNGNSCKVEAIGGEVPLDTYSLGVYYYQTFSSSIVIERGKLCASTVTSYSYTPGNDGGHMATHIQPKNGKNELLLPVEETTGATDGWRRQTATYEVYGPEINIGTQSGSPVYGAAGSASFAIKGESFGGTYPAFEPVVRWKSGNSWQTAAPTGVTAVLSGSGGSRTLTVTTAAAANAGDYDFKVVSGDTEALGTLSVSKAEYGKKDLAVFVDDGKVNPAMNIQLPAITGAAFGTVTVADNSEGLITAGTTPSVSGSILTVNVASVPEGKKAVLSVPVTGAANYKDFTMMVTVTAKTRQAVSVSGLSAPANRKYNGMAVTASEFGKPAYAPQWSGTLEYTYYEGTGTGGTKLKGAPKEAGAYTLVASIPESDANYKGSAELPFTIAKAALTAKADNKSIAGGEAVPAFTVTYTGFAKGDTKEGIVATEGVLSCAADGSVSGSYPITFGTPPVLTVFGAKNYTLTTTPGKLTVRNPFSQNVVISGLSAPKNRKYNGMAVTASEFGKPSYAPQWKGTLEYTYYEGTGTGGTKLEGAPKEAGAYTLVASIPADDMNFTGMAEVPFTIAKAAFTAKADSKFITKGDTIPAFTVTYTGFAKGDTKESIVAAEGVLSCAADGSVSGSFPITFGTLPALTALGEKNYTLIAAPGTLTVTSSGGGGGGFVTVPSTPSVTPNNGPAGIVVYNEEGLTNLDAATTGVADVNVRIFTGTSNIDIMASQLVYDKAVALEKTLRFPVRDANNAELYRIEVSGKQMKQSPILTKNMNLGASVSKTAEGTEFVTRQAGLMPGGVVTIGIPGFTGGSTQYVYRKDAASGAYVEVGAVQADTAGYVSFPCWLGGKYVVRGTAAAKLPVKTDTPRPATAKKGMDYTFRFTALDGQQAVFTTGNKNAFKTKALRRVGNNYYYQITATGKTGEVTGVYVTSAGGKAVQIGAAVVG